MLHQPVISSDPNDKILATWRLSIFPLPIKVREPIPVTRLADHRKIYLTYEGPLSHNRGDSRIVDRGEYRLIDHRPECWRIHFSGKILTGRFSLSKNIGTNDWGLIPENS